MLMTIIIVGYTCIVVILYYYICFEIHDSIFIYNQREFTIESNIFE